MKKDRTQISIHTDSALARKLREIAKAERRSLSAQIAKMLAEAVAWKTRKRISDLEDKLKHAERIGGFSFSPNTGADTRAAK